MGEPAIPLNGPPPGEAELLRFIAGRLTPEDERSLEARLKQDADARRLLEALREEDRLLREAAEELSAPPVKVGEKVLSVLHAERRQRVAAQHKRRLRNQILAVAGIAALVMIAFATLRPPSEAGRVVSGSGAVVQRLDGVRQPLAKDGRFYAGDTLTTTRGRFVRLRLAGDARVDLDEDSRLKIEQAGKKGAPVRLLLEAGRAGFETAGGQTLSVQAAGGEVEAHGAGEFDLWLPRASGALPPDWWGPWRAPSTAPAPAAQEPLAYLTVLAGSVTLTCSPAQKEITVAAGHRARFEPGQPAIVEDVEAALHALDVRQAGWHQWENGPQDRALLGLAPPFDWPGMGHNLGLTARSPAETVLGQALRSALDVLGAGEAAGDAQVRAARFAQGQQGLRRAAEALDAGDERHGFARALEGLAHYQRGRALLAVGTAEMRAEAASAFQAAEAAFGEALATPAIANARPKVDGRSKWTGYTPAEQGFLLAKFYLPWSVYEQRPWVSYGAPGEEIPALFEGAAADFGRSVEALVLRYGRALALTQAGRLDDAALALEELLAGSPVAGLADDSRACTEGLRQEAHLALARIYADKHDVARLRATVLAFSVRYPRESGSAIASALRKLAAEVRAGEP